MKTIPGRTFLAAILLGACARQEEPPATDQTPPAVQVITEARIRELEQQARALARTEGCTQASQCAAAPLGAKACGGPRAYLVYCTATTDEAALVRVLDELKRAEEAYNQAAGIVSDCMLVMPPQARVDGGACTAASP